MDIDDEERHLRVVSPDDEDILTVFRPGRPVVLAAGNEYVKAIVLAVDIQANETVTYKVAYWACGQRHEEWVTDAEVHFVDEAVPMKIGFASCGEKP